MSGVTNPTVIDRETGSETPHRRGVSPLSVAGLVLLLGGLGCLGWVVYQLFGTNVVAQHAYQQETSQLREQWRAPSGSASSASTVGRDEIVPGDAIAVLRIPRFGKSYEVPILQGTDLDTLAKGVGHYDDTAAPGQIGNFAIAGHRITHGQPFSRLEEMNKGDTVVVETRTRIYTYRMDTAPRDLTVKQTASWVLDAVPGQPSATPSRAVITLTTCQDLFHSPDRSVAFGALVKTEDK